MHEWEALLRETTSALASLETPKLELLAQKAESLAANQRIQGSTSEMERLVTLKNTLSALLESTQRGIHLMQHLRIERPTRGFSDFAS
ncbi:hypothetical protein AciPR4_1838 [Terriglobus saanensis SP1PR4]|uniref:Uncharacterized protein n=1 Tax=Terriglobus saanensis (strain ATCC BAA-1853 / DSM 23119 / SP1PR4) TaxID=401053 RepID=E8V5N5_TERSS|nr:hypothetical protein AciPR4_1838 [Terriglobus saanensis SP1PR4]